MIAMDAPDAVDRENGGRFALSATPVSPAGIEQSSASPIRNVKRPRPVKSCAECRKRKLRCDRSCPCSQCQKSHRVCKYPSGDQENGNESEASEPEAPVERAAKRVYRASVASPMNDPRPSVASRNSHDEWQGANASLLAEMSGRLERMEALLAANSAPPSVTSAPKRPSVVGVLPVTVRGLSVKGDLRTRFFGQNSTKVLLNLFDEAKVFMHNMADMDGVRELFMHMQTVSKALADNHRRLLEPMTVYVESITPIQKRMADILPPKPVCDKLLEAYIGASEGLYRFVHIPTFKQEYENFWLGNPPADTFLPRLLAMLSIGSRFDSDSRGFSRDRTTSLHWPTACAQVRQWLDGLKNKGPVDLTTLQAAVLLLHAQRTLTPRNQESWTQLGYIVRSAMTLGLHRDPSEFPQISVFWAENRRKLWYTIMDLDLHVALACNLPCAAREGEYSCLPPRNLDDSVLYPEMTELPEAKPIDQYTDTQMQAYAATTLPYRLKVSHIINRLDSLSSFDEVLELGARLESLLDDVNYLFPRHRALDTRKKLLQWRIRALLDLHVRRPLLSLYRPFALSTADCPPKISHSYLKSAMMMLTYMDELDHNVAGFSVVHDMYHLVMKHDVIQAAFSVCYYISNPPQNKHLELQSPNGQGSAMTPPDATDESSGQDSFESRPLWSQSVLVRAVENTLDSHIGLIKDSSSDLKDVVALSIVLNSVQGTPQEQKLEKLKAGIQRILDASMQALKSKIDGVAPLPTTAPVVPPGDMRDSDIFVAEDGAKSHIPPEMGPNGINTTGIPDEFSLWDWGAAPSFNMEQG